VRVPRLWKKPLTLTLSQRERDKREKAVLLQEKE